MRITVFYPSIYQTNMSENQSNKQLVTQAVKNDIKTNNLEHLAAIMPVADRYRVAKSLRLKGWKYLAEHYRENKKHIEALVAFNKARQVKLNDYESFEGLINSLSIIYDEHKEVFSREDLVLLDNQLSRIVSFYTIHLPVEKPIVDEGQRLLLRIQSHLQSAPSKEETPATHKVEYIYNALYGDMTIEEIRAEFARIMAPYFRERLEEEPKKKRGSKK